MSYASQDAAAARGIADALRAVGVEVWFDVEGGLEHGDEWDAKIRRQIKECVLFLPIISASTQARHEGYFRIEWELAAERAMGIASGVPFILPVAIDDTRENEALVPERFCRVQWIRLRGGEMTPEVQQRLRRLWLQRTGGSAAQDAGMVAGSAQVTAAPVTGRRVGAAKWLLGAAALALVIGASAWWWPRDRAVVNPAEAARPAPAATMPAVKAPDRSLVVLQLENLSPDPENAFFTVAMHAEIIATLQRIPDMKVVGRDSALALKRGSASLAELARRVGVANVITGSVQRAGNKVKIQLELRRASDEALLWSSPDKTWELRDVFELQREIADEVARVLQARGNVGTHVHARYLTRKPEAYDLMLKAGVAFFSGSKEGFLSAADLAGQALALDPDYASAAFMLAAVHTNLVNAYGNQVSVPEHAAKARRWALEAARLDPYALGASALAIFHNGVERDHARALEQAEIAVRSMPHDPAPHTFRGWALLELGRMPEALISLQDAVRIDPLLGFSLRNEAAALLYLRRKADVLAAVQRGIVAAAGQPGEAGFCERLEQLRTAVTGRRAEKSDTFSPWMKAKWHAWGREWGEVRAIAEREAAVLPGNPTRFGWQVMLHDALRRLGETSAASSSAADLLTLANELPPALDLGPPAKQGWIAAALVRVGRVDEGLAAARTHIAATRSDLHVLERWRRELQLAELLALAGRASECVEVLTKLLRVPCGLTVELLRGDPVWDPVREDPAFKRLLADPANDAPF